MQKSLTHLATVSLLSATLLCTGTTPSYAADIVDTAISTGLFKTLIAALQLADLIDTLKAPGPYTVFAPTDSAFAKLPAGSLETLLNDKASLVEFLKYHVVPGKIMAKQLQPGEIKTIQGASLTETFLNDKIMLDNAHVTQADIASDNGVIHAIDTVLQPKK